MHWEKEHASLKQNNRNEDNGVGDHLPKLGKTSLRGQYFSWDLMEHKGHKGAFCSGGLVELATWRLKQGQWGWSVVMSKGVRGPGEARQVRPGHARPCTRCQRVSVYGTAYPARVSWKPNWPREHKYPSAAHSSLPVWPTGGEKTWETLVKFTAQSRRLRGA